MNNYTKMVKCFLTAKEEEIVKSFSGLEGAIVVPTSYGDAVYVPPTREDSVLLVAHTDTVWSEQVSVRQDGDIISSRRKGVGIGADDRAGISALWVLRDLGHALLIVPEEETGCNGSREFSRLFPDLIKKHRYAIQFDRRGGNDLVRYNCDNPDFDDYLLKSLKGYELAVGSFSDICELCPTGMIAGVNISIGFMYEHTAREILNLSQWYNTVMSVKEMIEKECPEFKYIESERISYGGLGSLWGGRTTGWAGSYGVSNYRSDWYDNACSLNSIEDDIEWVYADSDETLGEREEYLFCPKCADEVAMLDNEAFCPLCGGDRYDMYEI